MPDNKVPTGKSHARLQSSELDQQRRTDNGFSQDSKGSCFISEIRYETNHHWTTCISFMMQQLSMVSSQASKGLDIESSLQVVQLNPLLYCYMDSLCVKESAGFAFHYPRKSADITNKFS